VAEQLPPLIQALHDPRAYPHPVARVALTETHISWVLLAGEFVYKIKKPLDLGFLDFSTLARREHFCREELRLNRRLAPALYLDVLPITGAPDAPVLGGPGTAIEYALKMRRFPQEALLDRVLARGALTPQHIDDLAQTLAAFHQRQAAIAPATSPFGSPDAVLAPMRQNFTQIRPRVAAAFQARLNQLAQWTETTHAQLRPVLEARHAAGFIRECHGDAHLGNMALLQGRVTLFDCLEFNDQLRWIDVISEIAFTVMDLDDRQHPTYAHRLLNGYLEATGDYAGLALLRFYLVYRALVRAKVAAIRLSQADVGAVERAHHEELFASYLALAERYTRPPAPALLITHGVSGAGKSTLAQWLVEALGAVRVRSDVERKRLEGATADAGADTGLNRGRYSSDMTARTYARLAELATTIVASGFSVVVDATFLRQAQRETLHAVARAQRVPFVILDLTAREDLLHARIAARAVQGRDASEATHAVLVQQLATREPLTTNEIGDALEIATEAPLAPDDLLAGLAPHLAKK
jgi:hypothetical protein